MILSYEYPLQLTDKDWKYMNDSIEEKIKEWLDDFPIINEKKMK